QRRRERVLRLLLLPERRQHRADADVDLRAHLRAARIARAALLGELELLERLGEARAEVVGLEDALHDRLGLFVVGRRAGVAQHEHERDEKSQEAEAPAAPASATISDSTGHVAPRA